jgi:putative two-component system response regulator
VHLADTLSDLEANVTNIATIETPQGTIAGSSAAASSAAASTVSAAVSTTSAALAAAVEQLRSGDNIDDIDQAMAIGLRVCQRLYSQGQANLGKDFAISLNLHRDACTQTDTRRRLATAAGLLTMYAGDTTSALEFHSAALQYAKQIGTVDESVRALNNIGSAWLHAGCYGDAVQSYELAVDAARSVTTPLFSRYSALTNLAQCRLYSGEINAGLVDARAALREISASPDMVDKSSQILLHRNIIRLLLESDNIGQTDLHVSKVMSLAAADGSMGARIASVMSQALVNIANGENDIARTRFELVLEHSRYSWADLRDTLACVVRAEELLRAPARAMIRLRELSELLHLKSIDAVEANAWSPHFRLSPQNEAVRNAAVKRRLITQLNPPSVPEHWAGLVRMAVAHTLPFDRTGQHGHRVGTLSAALASVIGFGPIEALEIGHAAKVHDIGLAVGHENLLAHHPDWREPESLGLAGHCQSGKVILGDTHHPRMLLAQDMAYYHHAAWDGSGYPVGISGKAIPIHARICAVADTFDTLMYPTDTNRIPSIEVAIRRLRARAGNLLDPTLVDAFTAKVTEDADAFGIDMADDDGLANFFSLVKSQSSRSYAF